MVGFARSSIIGSWCIWVSLLMTLVESQNLIVSKFVESNSIFSRNLFEALCNVSSPEDNVIVSPLSAHLALGMTYLGAAGNTAQEMKNALQLSDDYEHEAQFYVFSLVMKIINGPPELQLEIANRIYVASDVSLCQSYLNSTLKNFQSTVQSIDFTQPSSVDDINQWIESKTHGKINQLLPKGELGVDSRMVLINAVYFYAKWRYEFSPADSSTQAFYTNETHSIQTVFMKQKETFQYADLEELNAELLKMPYTGGINTTSMVILLPKSRNGLSSLILQLRDKNLGDLLTNTSSQLLQLSIPRMTLEASINVKAALEALGMRDMFDKNSANFSKIASADVDKLYVSKVAQKTLIQVVENGTEASTATYVHKIATSAKVDSGPTATPFTVDRPFLFFIIDDTSFRFKTVLFSGKVSDPKPNL